MYSLFLYIVRQLILTLQGSCDSMPFNPMEGPVTIPMEGLSLQCMYERLDYVTALSLLKCEENSTPP